jgi:cell division septation protein DedD
MADKETEAPTFNPKHRIIGAIILVSLAVILIPLVLDERETPDELQDSGKELARPAPATLADTRLVVTPVAELGTAAPARVEAPKPPVIEPVPAIVEPLPPVRPAPAPGAAAKETAGKPPAPAAEAARAPREKAAKVAKGWVVQVGVYSNPDNAQRVADKLKARHLPVLSDSVKLDAGRATRVRVGPYREKNDAERAQAQIQKEVGAPALVRAYP